MTVARAAGCCLAEKPVTPEARATFDTRLADPNPPYMTSLRILRDGVPANVLDPGDSG
jgi:hypothetical protein